MTLNAPRQGLRTGFIGIGLPPPAQAPNVTHKHHLVTFYIISNVVIRTTTPFAVGF